MLSGKSKNFDIPKYKDKDKILYTSDINEIVDDIDSKMLSGGGYLPDDETIELDENNKLKVKHDDVLEVGTNGLTVAVDEEKGIEKTADKKIAVKVDGTTIEFDDDGNLKVKEGSGAVDSVNGKTGAVVLKAEDIEDNDGNTIEEDLSALANDIEDLDTNKQNKNDITLETTDKTVVGAINELKSNKQDKTDNTLETTDKTVVGAINENKTSIDTLLSDKQDKIDTSLTTNSKRIVGAINENKTNIDSLGTNKQDKLTASDGIKINTDKEISVKVDGTTIDFDEDGKLKSIAGSGAVDSVNGKTGVVVLKAEDIKDNDGNTIEEDLSDINTSIESLGTDKQDKEDNTLLTTDKTVVGAINENKENIDSLEANKQNNLIASNGIDIDGSNNIKVKVDNDTIVFDSLGKLKAVGSVPIIDVDTLPTTDINDNVFYRINDIRIVLNSRWDGKEGVVLSEEGATISGRFYEWFRIAQAWNMFSDNFIQNDESGSIYKYDITNEYWTTARVLLSYGVSKQIEPHIYFHKTIGGVSKWFLVDDRIIFDNDTIIPNDDGKFQVNPTKLDKFLEKTTQTYKIYGTDYEGDQKLYDLSDIKTSSRYGYEELKNVDGFLIPKINKTDIDKMFGDFTLGYNVLIELSYPNPNIKEEEPFAYTRGQVIATKYEEYESIICFIKCFGTDEEWHNLIITYYYNEADEDIVEIGSGGAVDSVNGKTGAVVLKAEDIEDNDGNTIEEDLSALANDVLDLDTNKQDKLTASDGIDIDSSNNISVKVDANTIDINTDNELEVKVDDIKLQIIKDSVQSNSETWSSNKIKALIDAIGSVSRILVVATKPTTGIENTLYYVGTESPYHIWLYAIQSGGSTPEWIDLGTTAIRLNDYYTKDEVLEIVSSSRAVKVASTLPIPTTPNTLYYIGTEAPYRIYLYDSYNIGTYLGTSEISLTEYQKKEDENLETTSKRVVNAINELNTKLSTVSSLYLKSITQNTSTQTITIIDQNNNATTFSYGGGGGNVDDVKVDGTSVVRNKIAEIDLTGKADKATTYTKTQVDEFLDGKVDKISGKGLSTNDFTTSYKTTLDNLSTTHYNKTQVDDLLDDKVDKESGKGLSQENYTTAEKTKLNGIEAGAEVNVQSDWNQTNTSADDYIKNKPIINRLVVFDSMPSSLTQQQYDLLTEGKPSYIQVGDLVYEYQYKSGANFIFTCLKGTEADNQIHAIYVSSLSRAVYSRTLNLQEKLISGTNLKTINNGSILESGNINVITKEQGVSNYGKILEVNEDGDLELTELDFKNSGQIGEFRTNVFLMNNFVACDGTTNYDKLVVHKELYNVLSEKAPSLLLAGSDASHFKIVDLTGRYVKLDKDGDGDLGDESLPTPIITSSGSHQHTWNGFWTQGDAGSQHQSQSRQRQGSDPSEATTNNDGSHTHTFDTSGTYKNGAKVNPDHILMIPQFRYKSDKIEIEITEEIINKILDKLNRGIKK